MRDFSLIYFIFSVNAKLTITTEGFVKENLIVICCPYLQKHLQKHYICYVCFYLLEFFLKTLPQGNILSVVTSTFDFQDAISTPIF